MEQYTYRPLRDAPDSTRLLQIQPGVQGSEIHCLLFDYTIDQTRASGPYEALSYAWGDPTERQRIYVQDVQHQASISDVLLYLDVTTNLYAALQRLRDNIFPRLMWVDALCIDQENLQERATQVQFMVKIYLYATRVIVWLGAEADDSTSALVAIEDTAVRARQSQISGDEWAQFSDGDSLSPIEVSTTSSVLIENNQLIVIKGDPRSRCCSATFGDMRPRRTYRGDLCPGFA
jgi:hypothetical protein